MNELSRPVAFDPHRFQSAAAHYLSGRPAYAPALIARVARLCGLTDRDRVLDLGCGPGQLAIGFAFHAGAVLAVDPEPEMLRIATEAAAIAPNVEFRLASSYDLGPAFGAFKLVTIGRAFHWMDRTATLAMLDSLVEADGAIVLFGEKHPEVPENGWVEAFQALVNRYAETDSERLRRKSPDWPSHESMLLASRFDRLERVSIVERRRIAVDRFVDRALSLSSTSRRSIGEKANALVEEVRAMMESVAKDGLVGEVVESSALIARRSPFPRL